MSIEAMKQALVALEEFCQYANDQHQIKELTEDSWLWMMWKDGLKAIASLRQAIAEAEKQQPVAKIKRNSSGQIYMTDGKGCEFDMSKHIGVDFYTHPQPKAEQEPVVCQRCIELERLCDETYVAEGADAYNHACDEMERWQEQRKQAGKDEGTTGSLCDGIAWLYGYIDQLEAKLYTHPQPKREWVGLTDEEVNAFVWNMPYEPGQAEIRAIEAKLKEKNT